MLPLAEGEPVGSGTEALPLGRLEAEGFAVGMAKLLECEG